MFLNGPRYAGENCSYSFSSTNLLFSGCIGRALISWRASKLLICCTLAFTASFMTIQRSPCVQGGVVREPV